MGKLEKIILVTTIFFFILLSAWQMLNGSIVFHTDIARDFLLMEDVVASKKPTFIGPRSGGIPGVFHGPLWLYVNLPAYLLGQGNPVVVGLFWVTLFVISILTIYWVGKKIFSKEVGLIAALLFSAASSDSIPALFNPFGAVMLSPLFLLFFLNYMKRQNVIDLLLCFLTLGFIIQFQMAFGVPILVLAMIPIVFIIFKKKKYVHLFSFLIILIPLSTFIIFDLRHQFLQTKSTINYIRGIENTGKIKTSFPMHLVTRMKEMVLSVSSMFTKGNIFLSVISFILVAYSFIKMSLIKKDKTNHIFIYFAFFYIGYWILTLIYKGTIWSYYYWPFIPMLAILFAALIDKQNRIICYVAVLTIVIINGFSSLRTIIQEGGNYVKAGSWPFYYTQAKTIYSDTKGDFGYYIYTADQFGYSSRYAMNYGQKRFPDRKSYPYEKKPITYLIIFPSTNPFTSEGWWKINQVKIDRKPDKVFRFENGSYIEKYILTPAEQKIESDPNLIHSLIFR